MNQQSEMQLVELLKLGDRDAVEYWFNHFHKKILRFIQSRVENSQDAEEMTQQTFLNCLKNLSLYNGSASLWTWMSAIAKHEVADFYRKMYAKKAIQTTALSHLLLSSPVEDSHEVSARVLVALKKMNEYSRELLLKKYVDSQKVAQIATELGKTVKSVESELFRAREQFRLLYLEQEST
jgi:RNA polymerase sigma-70 factor (ECF subfamily)